MRSFIGEEVYSKIPGAIQELLRKEETAANEGDAKDFRKVRKYFEGVLNHVENLAKAERPKKVVVTP